MSLIKKIQPALFLPEAIITGFLYRLYIFSIPMPIDHNLKYWTKLPVLEGLEKESFIDLWQKMKGTQWETHRLRLQCIEVFSI